MEREGIIARTWRRVLADRTRSRALLLLGGNLGAHAITLLLLPMLTRVASPVEFGDFARYVSFVGVLLPVASLRYEWAIPLARDPARNARLIELSLWVLAAISLLTFAVASWPAARALTGGALTQWVAPGLVVLGCVQLVSSWTIRTAEFRMFTVARVLHSLFVGVAQIVLVMAFGGAGLIVGHLGGQVLAYAYIGSRIAVDARDGRQSDPAVTVGTVAQEYRRFPLVSAPSSLVNALGVEAPILLIGSLVGTASAGQLALAQRIAALPGMLVTQSLGQSFYSEAAMLARTEDPGLRTLYRRTVRHLALLGGVVAVALGAAPWIFPILFGAQWQTAGWMAAALGLLVFSQMTFGTVSCLEYLNRQGLNFLWNFVRLALVAAAIVVCQLLECSATVTVAVYSAASAVWYPALYAMNEYSLARAAGHPQGQAT